MLEFFRRHQRYLFLFITTVIVISFSFFGTYSALPSGPDLSQEAFRAVDGTLVSRAELDEMVRFLSTDIDDKLYYGGAWGPNFLNDGVLKKDVLLSGLGQVIAAQFPAAIAADLETRLANERRYVLYTHPQAQFVSTQSAWSYFAPEMGSNYQALSQAQNPLDPAAFTARVNLYLGEKRFSPQMLKQVLRYQEKQYSWLVPDENLNQTDLSLFGYHNIEDWFGPRFTRIAAEYIINTAIIAQQQGYSVSKEEVLADLSHNADLSYKQNSKSPFLEVANGHEYFNEQLRRMGMDQTRAVKVWQKVLLFRRLIQDAGNSVFVTPATFESYARYAKETVKGNLYELPKPLRLGDYEAFQKFELYLQAVAASGNDNTALLPQTFKSPKAVAQTTPELVQKKYLLKISEVDKNALLSKISLRETWNWEVQDDHWVELNKEFSFLNGTKGSNSNERFKVLDALNQKQRSKVDTYAREQILALQPNIILSALNDKEPENVVVGLPLKGPAMAPLKGVENSAALIALLDSAPLGQVEPKTDEEKSASEKLSHFSVEDGRFFKIIVLERQPNEEILTFADANKKGILDKLLTATLQSHYTKIRQNKPELYQLEDKTWKNYQDVKNLVADDYFADALKAIKPSSEVKQPLTGSQAASQRLYAYVDTVKQAISNKAEAQKTYVNDGKQREADDDSLQEPEPLQNQWKLDKKTVEIDRSSKNGAMPLADALTLKEGEWSGVLQAPNGALSFFQKDSFEQKGDELFMRERSAQEKQMLFKEVVQVLATQLAQQYKEKGAISLSYMDPTDEPIVE